MKFSIDRAPILDALQRVQSVVERKSTVPILGNILLSARGQELSLSATDLEVGMKLSLPIRTQTEGKITLSAKQFLDIVKELPDKELFISRKDNNWVELICGKSKFNLVSLAPEEYPALPSFEEKTYVDTRAEALRDMVDRTEFAVSTDATRYHLNGVFLEALESNLIRMTATDGHRLSFVDNEIFAEMPDMKRGMIIPKKGLSELHRLLAEESGSVGLAFERGYVFAKFRSSYLFVKLIEGEYPDYRMVIPKSTDRTVGADRTELNSALKRVSLLAHEKSRGVKLAIQNGMMTISSSNPDKGEAREEVDVDFSGEPLEIVFNSKYLLDCLQVLHSEKVELLLKDRLSPGILRGSEEKNHTYVIMPMRV